MTVLRAASFAASDTALAYVGSYSSPQGPEGSKGRGEGIYLFEQNRSTGGLRLRALIRNDANPSWLAFSPDQRTLYSGNEISNYRGQPSGSVSAYRVQPADGGLQLLNTVSSQGAGPAHLSVHPGGKWVFIANYAGGTVAALPVQAGGALGEASFVHRDEGKMGVEHAASAPPGSFAISGHDKPHAHMVLPDTTGRWVLASDLGLDRIYVWSFDNKSGKLRAANPAFVQLPGGDGPRHFVFHPNGRWLYSLQEESSTITTFDWNAAAGTLSPRQTLSTLPNGFRGTNFTSEVLISADQRFLYAANRLHDSIAWFSIGETGALTLRGEAWTRGDYPRSFNIDRTGGFLYSCNQRADAIAAFRVNRETGALTFLDQYTAVGTPAIIVFPS